MALIVKELQAFDSDSFSFHLRLQMLVGYRGKNTQNRVTDQIFTCLELKHKYS